MAKWITPKGMRRLRPNELNGAKRSKRLNGGAAPVERRRSRLNGAPALSVRNSYEAAGQGRRLRLWNPGSPGPNAASLAALSTLRDRSRQSLRDNGWMVQGSNNWISNEIGCGIFPKPMSSNEAFNTAIKKLWDDWTEVANDDGVLDYYGMLALAVRERRESGECFIRFRPRQPSDGLPVPLQLQLVEAEFCPETYNDLTGRIRAGIQFNGIGKRTAYWMYRSHPGDPFNVAGGLQDLVAVPADSVIHHYAPLRGGQIRGVPWTVQALIKAKDFDEYDDAELIRKKTRAAFTGVIQRPAMEENYPYDPMTGLPVDKDSSGVPIVNLESGTFPALIPGETIDLFEGDNTGGGYSDFVRQQLLGFAASLGVPYEFLTGDMSKVNDRLMRVILNEYHRLIEQTQWHLTIPQIVLPVWTRFVDTAVLYGLVAAPGYETKRRDYLMTQWNTHRWPYLNPLQDVQAAALEIKTGLQSRTGAAAERGMNAEDIDRQNAEDKDRAEKLGLDYETHTNSDRSLADPNAPDPDSQTSDQQQAYNRLRNFRRVNARHYDLEA